MINQKKVHYFEGYEKFAQMMDLTVSSFEGSVADSECWKPFEEYTSKVSAVQEEIQQLEGVSIKTAKYRSANGEALPYWIIRPQKSWDKDLPCLWYIHGGNWLMGYGYDVHRFLVTVAKELGCCCISNEYHGRELEAFPMAVEDCYSFGEFVYDNAVNLGICKNQVILAGESAGGNLAAATMLMYRDRDSRFKPVGNFINAGFLSKNFEKMWSAELWGKEPPSPSIKMVLSAFRDYTRNGIPTGMESYAEPLKASSYERLAPTVIEMGDNDILSAHNLDFASNLAVAGIQTAVLFTHDTIHGSVTGVDCKFSDQYMKRRLQLLRRLFERSL